MSLILVINPGSTSTKAAAVFKDGNEVFKKTLSAMVCSSFPFSRSVLTIRKDQILKRTDRNGIRPSQLMPAARGGD